MVELLDSVVSSIFGFPGVSPAAVLVVAAFLGVVLYLNFLYQKGKFFNKLSSSVFEVLFLGLFSLYIICIISSAFAALFGIFSAKSAIELTQNKNMFVAFQSAITLLLFVILVLRPVNEATKPEKIRYWKPKFEFIKAVLFGLIYLFFAISLSSLIVAIAFNINYLVLAIQLFVGAFYFIFASLLVALFYELILGDVKKRPFFLKTAKEFAFWQLNGRLKEAAKYFAWLIILTGAVYVVTTFFIIPEPINDSNKSITSFTGTAYVYSTAKDQIKYNSLSSQHEDYLNINLKFLDKAMLYYNPKERTQEEYYYNILDNDGKVLSTVSCSKFEEDMKTFSDKMSKEPHYYDYYRIQLLAEQIHFENLPKNFFNTGNSNPICLLSSEPPFKTIRVQNKYAVDENLLDLSDVNSLLPYVFYRPDDKNTCRGYIDFKMNSTIQTRLYLDLYTPDNKSVVDCPPNGFSELYSCRMEQHYDWGNRLVIDFDKYLPKRGSFIVDFNCSQPEQNANATG